MGKQVEITKNYLCLIFLSACKPETVQENQNQLFSIFPCTLITWLCDNAFDMLK